MPAAAHGSPRSKFSRPCPLALHSGLPQGKCVLWQPHPLPRSSQPVKTLLSWLKANLILQTSAAFGLSHNGQVSWGRLPDRGGVRVRVLECARVCVPARVCAPACGVCVRVRMRPLAVALGSGGAGSWARARLRHRTRVFVGLLHLRPSPSTAGAKGPKSGEKPDVLLPPLRLPWGH